MLLWALPFASCNKNEEGAPIIHSVRTTDPALKDSTFVAAFPGQMLLIEGRNFASVKKIFINDQDAPFNPNYVLPGSIILTIPAELELTGTDPDLPKEIRIENNAGVGRYSFHVLSPVPVITRLQLDRYPALAGDEAIIHGENFYEIDRIVLEGENGTDTVISSYVINPEVTRITFNIPSGAEPSGELVVYCAAGEAIIPYSLTLPPPTILTFSSDMPVRGAEFFITGTYFVGVQNVNINGEIDIPVADLRVSSSVDTIYMKLPTLPTRSGVITVTTGGGNSDSDKVFYPIENLIIDWDNVGGYSWGEGKVFPAIDGVSDTPPYTTSGNAGAIMEVNVGGSNWWFGNLVNWVQFPEVIADNVPVADLVVRFECFVAYSMFDINYSWKLIGTEVGNYVPRSRLNSKTEIGRWMTCEMPLSEFANPKGVATWGEVKALGDAEMAFYSKNPGVPVPQYENFFDNMRIVPKE